jgi:hypothetical protein
LIKQDYKTKSDFPDCIKKLDKIIRKWKKKNTIF